VPSQTLRFPFVIPGLDPGTHVVPPSVDGRAKPAMTAMV
jgi:hypothetical protein